MASPEAEARGAARSGALYVSPVGDAKRRLYGAGPEITHGLGAFLYVGSPETPGVTAERSDKRQGVVRLANLTLGFAFGAKGETTTTEMVLRDLDPRELE